MAVTTPKHPSKTLPSKESNIVRNSTLDKNVKMGEGAKNGYLTDTEHDLGPMSSPLTRSGAMKF